MEPQKPESVGDAPTISKAPNTGDSPTALDSPAKGGDTRAPTIGDTKATLANAAGAGVVPPRTSGVSDHPSMIGHYRILRLLGEGGMGSVYLAEQENPHRIVALKVIKPGFVNTELLRRFEQEANALGRLQHAGIAQIYEAGTADSGAGPQPFFAMEFIAGWSLIEYAEERRLNARDRLELMAKVCDAVNHAHQRGIIHRDLKPGTSWSTGRANRRSSTSGSRV